MIRFSASTRGAFAAILLTTTLAVTAWAVTFQSGYDVGAYCDAAHPGNQHDFNVCKDGGCAALHADDPAGFADCEKKADWCKANPVLCKQRKKPVAVVPAGAVALPGFGAAQ